VFNVVIYLLIYLFISILQNEIHLSIYVEMFIVPKQLIPIQNFTKEFKNLHKFVKNKYCRADHHLTLFESFADLANIRKNTRLLA
jgi:hypothetical protein